MLLTLFLIVSCEEKKISNMVAINKEMASMTYFPDEKYENTPKKITKIGQIKFENKNLKECRNYLIDLMKANNALIISEEYLANYFYSYKFKTSVPSAKFDSIITVLISKYGEPEFYKVEIDDFTQSYYDTDARLRSKKAYLEKCYSLLKNANKISDLLEIESKISKTIEEIERMTGAIKNYDYLTDNYNLDIEFENYEKKSEKEQSFFEVTISSFKSGFVFAKDGFSFLLSKWPLWLFIAFIYFTIRYFKRKRKK